MTRHDSDEFSRTLERELGASERARRAEDSWWKERHDYKNRAEKAEAALLRIAQINQSRPAMQVANDCIAEAVKALS